MASLFRRRAFLAGIFSTLALVVTPQAAFSTTPPVVTIDAALKGPDELIITTTSHMERISVVSMEVTSAGELFTIDIAPISLKLPLEVPVTVSVPMRLTPSGGFGTAIVRIVDASLGAVKVVEFTFTRTNGLPRSVSHTEYAAAVNAILDDRDAAVAEQRAAELIRSVLARGKRPVATGGVLPSAPGRAVENSNFERAWNRLVAQLGVANGKSGLQVSGKSLHPRPAVGCGPYVESPDNRDYPVQGNIYYANENFFPYPQKRPLQEPGYQGFVTTYVAFENDCFVQYRIRAFDYTTSWGGSFSVTVRTIDDPSVRDPILYISTTAPDAGERLCPDTCTGINTVQQLLYPPDDHFQYVGGAIQLAPYYNTNIAPSRYLFHWNDEIKSLQRNWSYNGFGSYYTPFIAGHDSNAADAYFFATPPGIIAIGDGAKWNSLWLIAHECGHFFQFKLQGNRLGYGQPHFVCQQIGVGPAFREGFADWHGSFWETDGRNVFVPCNGGECYSNCGSGGYSVELNVAAFFWDVFDYTNDPAFDLNADTVGYPFGLLFYWAGRDYTSFDDFYTDFRNRGAWGSSESVTATLRTVNRVDVP
jgi:hypothetical protein